MRLLLASALVFAAGCGSVTPEAPPLPASGADTPSGVASPEASACGPGAVADLNPLFDATPTSWALLAPRLLGCSRGAIAALPLGEADTSRSTPASRVETYRRRAAGRTAALVVAYGAGGAVTGVSIAERVPERIAETVFDLRAEQLREVVRGERAASPPGTLVYPAFGARAHGVRLALSPPFLVLSVVQE